MREIKFSGRDINGKWWYGSLVLSSLHSDGLPTCWIKEHDILGLGASSTPTSKFHEVDPKTVGQYTGLKDKNGREIYEGDIVTGDSWKEPYARRTKKQVTGRVVFADGYGFMFTTNNIDGTYRGLPKGCRTYPNLNRCEVIGNIHENGDLLK